MVLSGVDLGILIVIGLSVITGLIRGFLKELIALVIWASAIWLALNYFNQLTPWLQHYIHDQTVRAVIAFLMILLGTLLAGAMVNMLFGFVLVRSGLSGTDRILGMVFGFARGAFIVVLVIATTKMTSIPYQNYVAHSTLYPKFEPIVTWFHGLMPQFIGQMNWLEKQQKEKSNAVASKSKPKKTESFLIHPEDFELSSD